MRLLHVISSVDPSGGGPIEGIKQLAAALAENDAKVEVATIDHPEAPWLKAFPLPVHALGPSHTHYCYSSRVVPWLKQHASRFDAVIVNGLWQFGGMAVRKVLHGTATPYFVFTHGMLDPWFKHTYPLKHAKKWLYWPWGEYRVLRDARAVFFTCEEERRLARESFWLYRCNEVVVNYGTSGPAGDSAIQREAFLAQFPELHGKRIVLFLSRIHEKKGCDLLVDAFAKVSAADAGLHLVMAGPDQTGWQKTLVARAARLGIENRITWTGMVSGELKWGAYRAAEVFLLPSHQENFGIVVAEALACGLPVLISNKVNIWREIEGDRAGLVADDTPTGTLSLLERWLALSNIERARLAENAIACFNQRFEIHAAANSLCRAVAVHAFSPTASTTSDGGSTATP